MYGVKIYGVFSMPVYREFPTKQRADVFAAYWLRECPYADIERINPPKKEQNK